MSQRKQVSVKRYRSRAPRRRPGALAVLRAPRLLYGLCEGLDGFCVQIVLSSDGVKKPARRFDGFATASGRAFVFSLSLFANVGCCCQSHRLCCGAWCSKGLALLPLFASLPRPGRLASAVTSRAAVVAALMHAWKCASSRRSIATLIGSSRARMRASTCIRTPVAPSLQAVLPLRNLSLPSL